MAGEFAAWGPLPPGLRVRIRLAAEDAEITEGTDDKRMGRGAHPFLVVLNAREQAERASDVDLLIYKTKK